MYSKKALINVKKSIYRKKLSHYVSNAIASFVLRLDTAAFYFCDR